MRLDLEEYAETASLYHGGQDSMLYAVASTGGLKCGTIRPDEPCECEDSCDKCKGGWRPATDVEWFRGLCVKLETEASEAAEIAENDTEDEDASQHAEELREIERIAREWLDKHKE